jgi:RNA polymerase sigma-70 factor, ECF subfamily
VFFKKRNKVFDLTEVLAGCRNNAPASQKLLFENYSKLAMRICSKYATNDLEAEEMIMDGFFKVFKNINKYDEGFPFGVWFSKIMVNTSIDYFRKNHSRIAFTTIEEAYNVDFAPESLDLLSVDEILDFVRKLSPVYRTVFSLAVIDGYSSPEISEMLGVTESAVRANLSKAKGRLQVWINDYLKRQ